MTGIFGQLLGIAGPIVLWLMKRAGVREEAQQVFLASIKAIQAGPEQASAAADEEAAAIKRLHDRLQTEQAQKPGGTS